MPPLIFALIVVLGYFVQALTGFGSMVVIMSLGLLVVGREFIMLVVVPYSILQCAWIVYNSRRSIPFRFMLLRVIFPMASTTFVGIALSEYLPEVQTRLFFGALITGLAAYNLVLARSVRTDGNRSPLTSTQEPAPFSPGLQERFEDTAFSPPPTLPVLGAGVLHGLYATGGPLLVFALGSAKWSKERLRASLCLVWTLLNLVLLSNSVLKGAYTAEVLYALLCLVPAWVIGFWAGDRLHRRIDQASFMKVVWGVLLISGATLLAKSVYSLNLMG